MKNRPSSPLRQRGLTLVELMVALVLGLVVIGAVVNLFLTNRQTYRTTENLARMQENLRFAFELMARDVREAGATACGATNFANVLNGTPATWSWQGESLTAYAPGVTLPSPAPTNIAAGSPVLSVVKGSDPANEIRVTKHDRRDDPLTLSSTANLQCGDILFVCKTPYAAIFQATGVDANSRTVSHTTSGDVTPGNCLDYFPPASTASCNPRSPDEYISFTDGTLVKFQRILWYVGTNDRGGTSLYRKVVNNDLDKNGPVEMIGSCTGKSPNGPVEMVPDIDQLTLSFLYTDINGSRYLPLESIPDWTQVRAVRILVRSVSTDKVGTDGQPLRREYPFTIALRNRLN